MEREGGEIPPLLSTFPRNNQSSFILVIQMATIKKRFLVLGRVSSHRWTPHGSCANKRSFPAKDSKKAHTCSRSTSPPYLDRPSRGLRKRVGRRIRAPSIHAAPSTSHDKDSCDVTVSITIYGEIDRTKRERDRASCRGARLLEAR